MEKPTLYIIGGPTASGKSGLAMELAARVDGVLINADSMQIYQGLPLLTAQPSAEDKAACPHLLYEIADPAERFSVALWLEKARAAMGAVVAQNKTPILVGGTGLYFKALLEGLSEIPPIPEEVRNATQALYVELGHEAFRARLAALDPESAKKIKPNDKQRLIRAFEVVTSTKQPMSAWHNKNIVSDIELSFHVKQYCLTPPRETLYAACDRRFLLMMEGGAVEEAKEIHARQLDPDLPAMKILGVRELGAFLRGEMTREAAIEKAQQMTRNYAKRQMTWFRNQWTSPDVRFLTTPDLPRDL